MNTLSSNSLLMYLKNLCKKFEFFDEVYLVGGAVRDAVLKRETWDYDFCVEKKGGAEVFCRFLFDKAPDVFSQPHHLGAQYPIWQVAVREDLDAAHPLEKFKGIELEVADTQREMFPDLHTRQRVTTFGSLLEDCRRRDFTCNMLYWSLSREVLLDLSGVSQQSIEKKILKLHPEVDGAKIFSDDPLRILRLFRFHCQLGFSMDPQTLETAINTRERMKILSVERLRDELFKMSVSGFFERGLKSMQEAQIFEVILPELLPMFGSPQDPKYHFEGDVWTHTLLVVKNAEKTAELQWAALLHDVGKPATTTFEGDRIKHLGHEVVSAEVSRQILERLRVPKKTTEKIIHLVELHLRGGDSMLWKSQKPARKLMRDAGDDLDDLLKLVEADSKSSLDAMGRPRIEHLEVLKNWIAKARVNPPRLKPMMSGADIMDLLNIEPGPKIREVQNFVVELEDEFSAEEKALDLETIKLRIFEKFK